jgi:tRNA(fMet)-specific endonuclease VapC
LILSLDSNVVVEILREDRPHYRSQLDAAIADGASIRISAIVVQELAFGAHRTQRPAHHIQLLDEFLSPFVVESFTHDDALVTGRLRSDLEESGMRGKSLDMLIAGQALAREWTLVTADWKDFVRVPGLRLIDWSDPVGPRELVGGVARLIERLKRD